jgi:hypothetical protein
MVAGRDSKAVLIWIRRLVAIPGFDQQPLKLLVPNIAEAFEKKQSKNVLLVISGIDGAPKDISRPPEVALKLLLSEPGHRSIEHLLSLFLICAISANKPA